MKQIEAMKQWLEAMEEIRSTHAAESYTKADIAIASLRQSIEDAQLRYRSQQDQMNDPVAYGCFTKGWHLCGAYATREGAEGMIERMHERFGESCVPLEVAPLYVHPAMSAPIAIDANVSVSTPSLLAATSSAV